MLQLDDANLIRKSIGDTRQKIYVLQQVEKLLVEKIQVICKHDSKDRIHRIEDIDNTKMSVATCGICNKVIKSTPAYIVRRN